MFPNDAMVHENVMPEMVKNGTLELRQGRVNGVQVAWTRLTNAQAGDTIWLEISGRIRPSRRIRLASISSG